MSLKSLYLLRHAKAVEGGILYEDKDRPLSEKGLKDARRLGENLLKKSFRFDRILTSPAMRTIETAQLVAKGLGYKKNDITIEGHLYSSNVEAILNLIDSTANKINSLLIVGHNPEISGLASYLSGKSISMDTCSMVELIFEIKDWDGINKNNLVKINLLN